MPILLMPNMAKPTPSLEAFIEVILLKQVARGRLVISMGQIVSWLTPKVKSAQISSKSQQKVTKSRMSDVDVNYKVDLGSQSPE